MAEQLDRPAGGDLPAPYQSSWSLLRRDLLALLASLRLELWQLWRRNRQGDLPRPAFWPPALGAWFWPLLLGLVLSLLAAVGWPLRALRSPVPAGPFGSPDSSLEEPAVDDETSRPPGAVERLAEDARVEEAAPEQPLPVDIAPAAQQNASPEPDPLLQAFAAEPGAGVLRAARLRQRDGDLELVLDGPDWQALPAAERQRLAEQWQRQAASLGAEHLWLLDGRGTPLGRSARVGSGMILLASPPPAHAP